MHLGCSEARHACYLGQPVAVGADGSVIRLALGADSLREYVTNPTRAEEADTAIVGKLALLVARFEEV